MSELSNCIKRNRLVPKKHLYMYTLLLSEFTDLFVRFATVLHILIPVACVVVSCNFSLLGKTTRKKWYS